MARQPVRVKMEVIKIACTCGRDYDRSELDGLKYCERCGTRVVLGTLDVAFSGRVEMPHAGVAVGREPVADPSARIRVRRHEITPRHPGSPGFNHQPGSYLHELRAGWVKAT